ncbi:MAG: type III-A CRISPR-associated protein Csm2 [Bacteroidota bacterium]|nr:type III-A CRISPR-associated protein Csm2 [Bacteroidota bacterium]
MPDENVIKNLKVGLEMTPKWIREGLTKEAIEFAEGCGKDLAGKLTSSQIRNAYGEVKRIQMKKDEENFETDVALLKPRLAYAKVRKTDNEKRAADELGKILSKAIETVLEERDYHNQRKRFDNFAAFFEAILAYHRANGGN